MKARYTIRCCRCGYEWTGKKGSAVVVDFFEKDGGLIRLCENCICDIGRSETDEEQLQIINEGRFVVDE